MITIGIIWLIIYIVSIYKVFWEDAYNPFWERLFDSSSFILLISVIITAIVSILK
jgi:hypothetical protein